MKLNRNLWLDLFKLVLCWMVICIHFLGEEYDYYPMYRLAVPLFFTISGYYSFRTGGRRRQALGMMKRTFLYLLQGFLFYIVYDFIMCYLDGNGVGYYFTTLFYEDFLLEFVILNRPITYTGAHLWYLIALFIVSVIHFALAYFRKLHWYRWIVPVTLAIQLFFGGYMRLYQFTDMPIRYTRNALFMGLPFFGLGYLLAQLQFHKYRWLKYLYFLLALFFLHQQIPEAALVETEVYITTVPAVIFTLLFFIGLPSIKSDLYYRWFGKNMSFYVYILHMAVGVWVKRLVDFPTPLAGSLIILAISIGIYEACYLIWKGFTHLTSVV